MANPIESLQMHSFRVVKELHGWAVRLGNGMSTPFWSHAGAVEEAHRMSAALRRQGGAAEVVIETLWPPANAA